MRSALHHGILLLLLLVGATLSATATWWAIAQSQALWQLSRGSYTALVAALLLATGLGIAVFGIRLQAWRRGAWDDRSAAPFRFGFYLFVLGTAVYLAWWQPFKPYSLALFWGVVAGVFAAGIEWGGRLGRRVPRRLLRGVDLALFNLCALAVLAEGGLRLVAAVRPAPLFAAEDMSVAGFLSSNRLSAGHVHLGFASDENGYYDRRREGGRPWAAVIGDSFGVGVVPHYYHYTTVAERGLGGSAELYNVGVSAAGPAEYLHMMVEDVLPLGPRCVVIALFVGNDVAEARRFRPAYPLLRRIFERGNLQLYLVPSRLLRVAAESEAGAGPVGVAQGGVEEDLVEQSEAALGARFPWLGDPRAERGMLSPETFFAVEADRCRHVCDPSEEGAYERLFAALEELERRAAGVPLQVMLVPDQFQVDDALWREVGERLGREDYDRDQPQRLIGAWLEQRGIPHLDLLPVFRAVVPLTDGRRHLYHLRDTHWNRRGNEIAGRELARFVAPWLR